MKFPTFKNELECLAKGFAYVAGCDEVGVAPLAGPVVAAACIIDPQSVSGYRSKSKWYYRVRDSKTTQESERELLAEEIKSHCIAYGIGEVSPETIDSINIHHASLLAMKQAVQNMLQRFDRGSGEAPSGKIYLFVDGRFVIKELADRGELEQRAVVDGDASVLSISAASIIAKVYRDAILRQLDQVYPQFGFAQHKGYPTKQHRLAIAQNGVTPAHRRSFLKNYKYA